MFIPTAFINFCLFVGDNIGRLDTNATCTCLITHVAKRRHRTDVLALIGINFEVEGCSSLSSLDLKIDKSSLGFHEHNFNTQSACSTS